MTFAADMRAATVALLDIFGQPATISRVTRTYDASTGKSAETASTIATRCAKPKTRTTAVDGVLTRTTSAVMLDEIAIGDSLTTGGRTYRVTAVDRADDPTGAPISIKVTLE